MLQSVWARLPTELKTNVRKWRYKRQIKAGNFRSPELEFNHLERYIKPSDWVMDIGANVGHYTLEMARLVGKGGRVVAFEPIPDTFSLLTLNVHAAGYHNVTLINAAVSDRCWLAGFEMPDGNPYRAHISEASTNKILCVSPVAFSGSDHRISFIKIDAEGHEPQIVEALEPLIQHNRPVLMVECNTEFLESWTDRNQYRFNDIQNSHNHILEPV